MIGCPISCVDGPSKPLILASAIAAMPARVLVEHGLVVCDMRWVKVSSSDSSEALWSRAPSVWSRASERSSGRTTSNRRIRAAFFLGGIVRVFFELTNTVGVNGWTCLFICEIKSPITMVQVPLTN
jgi:hypothetical protein